MANYSNSAGRGLQPSFRKVTSHNQLRIRTVKGGRRPTLERSTTLETLAKTVPQTGALANPSQEAPLTPIRHPQTTSPPTATREEPFISIDSFIDLFEPNSALPVQSTAVLELAEARLPPPVEPLLLRKSPFVLDLSRSRPKLVPITPMHSQRRLRGLDAKPVLCGLS